MLAKSTEHPEKRMLAMQREQRAMLELQRFERIAALERRIFEHAFAAFDQVEQGLLVVEPGDGRERPWHTTTLMAGPTSFLTPLQPHVAMCAEHTAQGRVCAGALSRAPRRPWWVETSGAPGKRTNRHSRRVCPLEGGV